MPDNSEVGRHSSPVITCKPDLETLRIATWESTGGVGDYISGYAALSSQGQG